MHFQLGRDQQLGDKPKNHAKAAGSRGEFAEMGRKEGKQVRRGHFRSAGLFTNTNSG
jgi:hypothetical protein